MGAKIEGDDWVQPFDFRDGIQIRTTGKFDDYYELYEEIGKGKFAKVYRCIEKATRLKLAAKSIRLKKDMDFKKVEKEVNIMTKMRHRGIAQIYDAFATSTNEVILIMEIVEGGELFERVAAENYILSETAVSMIVYQICEALRYIHSQNIIYLDLKLENIMCVSEAGNQIKLIDFGLAQYLDGQNEDLLRLVRLNSRLQKPICGVLASSLILCFRVFHHLLVITLQSRIAMWSAANTNSEKNSTKIDVNIMTQMRHRGIAQIYDAFATSTNEVILNMEIVEGGELFERVAAENYILTETAVSMIVYQICEALRYIHSQNIILLDLKLENIMCVSEAGNQIKLIDFGLAQYLDGQNEDLFTAGALEFPAPEVVKYEPLDFHTDMWSVGVITYTLLSGVSPFVGDNVAVTYCNVELGKYEFGEEFDENCISDEAKDFIQKLIIVDKHKRMLPEDCMKHPWIQSMSRSRKQSLNVADEEVDELVIVTKTVKISIARSYHSSYDLDSSSHDLDKRKGQRRNLLA
ncbi:protein kinase domain-containing protein [Ditylenchus destructor]|uniref:Protein kinase domain-containing protein n=1 Tax=Ditylenchus destructor TaxID=166010 RepID=A0AAD4MTW2_9BILA|nr:protein kinase domain-containing protein [Ditylenchus destructor]